MDKAADAGSRHSFHNCRNLQFYRLPILGILLVRQAQETACKVHRDSERDNAGVSSCLVLQVNSVISHWTFRREIYK